MAQKTLSPKSLPTKARKMPLPSESVTPSNVSIEPAQPAQQQYPEVNAAIERGIADVAAGKVYTRRSYAEFADIDVED